MSLTECKHCGQGHVCHVPPRDVSAVLEDIALALDAKAEVARIYGEEDRAVAYVDAAVMVRRKKKKA